MAYATVEDVESGFRDLTEDEQAVCSALLDEAAVIIDSYAEGAAADRKKVVSCRMVRRSLGSDSQSYPIGATQGSVAAGGYSQSWTITGGSVGELYLAKLDRRLLGISNQIGSYSPIEELVPDA